MWSKVHGPEPERETRRAPHTRGENDGFFLSGPDSPNRRSQETPADGRMICLDELGQGRTCSVYLAKDREYDRLVALKVWRGEEFSADVGQALFEREARLLDLLDNHSSVIRIYEVIGYATEDGAIPAQLLELGDGGSLDAYLQGLGETAMEEHVACRIFGSICEGAAAMHSAGIVHQDIKPPNILQVGDTWKLGDATYAVAPTGGTDTVLSMLGPSGTLTAPAFRAPEMMKKRHSGSISPCSDVYALGLILLLMVYAPARALVRECHAEDRASRLLGCVRRLNALPNILKLILSAAKTPAKSSNP